MNLLTWAELRRRGAPIGWWTIVGGDVNDVLPPPETALEQAKRDDGGVVLLHDFDRGQERAAFVLRSTQLLLDAADERGWRLRTLGGLTQERYSNAA